MVFEITPEELAQADLYEVDDYKRVKCRLKSGIDAWVYVQSGLNIDVKKLPDFSKKRGLVFGGGSNDDLIYNNRF